MEIFIYTKNEEHQIYGKEHQVYVPLNTNQWAPLSKGKSFTYQYLIMNYFN